MTHANPLTRAKPAAGNTQESVARGRFRYWGLFAARLRTYLGLLGFEPGRRAPATWPATGGQPFQAQNGFIDLFTLPAQVFQYRI